MRPLNKEEEEGEMIVQKVGNDALTINGQMFTFDSVADIDSTQVLSIVHLTIFFITIRCSNYGFFAA